MVFLGCGLWSLIGQRLLVAVVRALVLQWRIGFLILPRWSPTHIRDIGRFASLSFLDRLVDNLTYLAFYNVVGMIYGVAVLGYVNMAMRLIEPIRGAIAATGHNLAFSFFAPACQDRVRLQKLAETVVSHAALAIAPVFAGMAAIAPALLPIIAGPGWDEAIDITICLAIGSFVAVPSRLIYTALSASARPEFGLLSTLVSFVVMLVILVGTSALGPISVGLSRIAGDAAGTAVAIGLSPKHLFWTRRGRLGALLPAWLLAGTMGLAVAAIGAVLPVDAHLHDLALMVVLGVFLYGALLGLFARPSVLRFAAILRPTGSA
jgi:O-antigen/teichoic acid export membrane protein